MSKKIALISLISLSLLLGCSINNNKFEKNNLYSNKQLNSKLSLIGKVEFPDLSKFKTKATSAESVSNTTVSILYPPDHSTLANNTIATGLTDNNGVFSINTDVTFNPTINGIYILEAIKRLNTTNNPLISIRTYIKWTGTNWTSITGTKIVINSKTTALASMVSLLGNSLTSDDAIEKISITDNIVSITDIKKGGTGSIIIKADSINKVSDMLIDFILSKNYDPSQYLVYQNGKFSVKEPKSITNIITTVVGNSDIVDNIQATSTLLSNPNSIIFDSSNNMYISDNGNNRIRKVDKITGIITTIVGTGVAGFSGDNGQAINAQLNSPNNITFDSLGNLYIADSGNNRIRKVDKITGIITTVVGTGVAGFSGDNGLAINAQLGSLSVISPSCIAFDSLDNMYISDTTNHRIRKIDKITGIITTVVGTGVAGFSGDNGLATNAQLVNPSGIAFDSLGNLYIADSINNRIRKVDKITGIITTLFSSKLSNPNSIALDINGNIYVNNRFTHDIKKFDKITGIITNISGVGVFGFSGDNGQAINAQLNSPNNITFDSLGNLYIADGGNNRIRKIDKITGIITTVVGGIGDNGLASNAKLVNPSGIAFDSLNNMYIVDSSNRIRKVDKITGIITTIAGNGVAGFSGDNGLAINAQLNLPNNITFDSLGNLYITDGGNNRIRKVDKNTGIITTIAGTGIAGFSGDNGLAINAQLIPVGLAFDSLGNLYIADGSNNRIRKIDKITGIITTIAGNGVAGFSGDNGQAISAQLNWPNNITFDSLDNMYISDYGNNRIRKIDKITGVITTIAGNGVNSFSGDNGLAINAQLNIITGIIFDSLGNMYISDYGSNRIRKIDKITGIITTITGTGLLGFSGDNEQGIFAQLFHPLGIAFDLLGNLYIADSDNNRIRKVTLPPEFKP
ncbi:MAG: hypothetical protein U0457_08805 [Candidatus Sericytochromatia bacterium]